MLAPTLALLALSVSTFASPVQLPFLSPSSAPTSLANSTSKPVHVALGVMSRCPDASLCETVWDRVLEERLPAKFGSGVVADLVDMELVFIAQCVLSLSPLASFSSPVLTQARTRSQRELYGALRRDLHARRARVQGQRAAAVRLAPLARRFGGAQEEEGRRRRGRGRDRGGAEGQEGVGGLVERASSSRSFGSSSRTGGSS